MRHCPSAGSEKPPHDRYVPRCQLMVVFCRMPALEKGLASRAPFPSRRGSDPAVADRSARQSDAHAMPAPPQDGQASDPYPWWRGLTRLAASGRSRDSMTSWPIQSTAWKKWSPSQPATPLPSSAPWTSGVRKWIPR